MNQKLCPVCNTVNTNTDRCINCGNMFVLPNSGPVITTNVLDNMPIASTIPISTENNIAPPLSSLQQENTMPTIEPIATVVAPQPVSSMPQVVPVPIAPVSVNSAPVSAYPLDNQPVQTGGNQILPQMQVLLGQEPTLSKQKEEKINNEKMVSNFNIFKYIINAFIKPFDTFKNNIDELAKPKYNLLIALILILGLTIFGLFGTMINAVRVSSFFSSEVTWLWSNLKKVAYIKIIFTSLFMYAGIIYGISGVYFLAGLILKKDVNYMKISSSVLTSFIPFAFISIITSITSWFLPELLTLLLYVFSGIYTLMSFMELMNDQINIENKNNKIYFNFSCMSILFIIALLTLKILVSL